LGAISYWFDESFIWRMISFDWGEMFGRINRDNSPPLYHVVLKTWAAVFGDSPTALRAFSAVCSTAAVLGVYLFVRAAYREPNFEPAAREVGRPTDRHYGERTALLAAVFMALSPFQIAWAMQVRMYAMLTAVVALSSWLMMRAVQASSQDKEDDKASWSVFPNAWTLYTLSALAVAYTHYFGLFAVAAQYIFLLGLALRQWGVERSESRSMSADRTRARESGRRMLRAAMISLGAVVVGCALWAPIFARQLTQVRDSFWIPPATGRMVATTVYQTLSYSEYDVPSDKDAVACLDLLVLLLIALVWWAQAADWYVALSAALPPTMALLADALGAHLWNTHYFLAVHLFWLVALAVVVSRIGYALPRRLAIAVLICAFAATSALHWRLREAQARLPGMREAMAWLDAGRVREEPVVVCSPMLFPDVLAHSQKRQGIKVFQTERDYRHYEGTAVLRTTDLVDDGWMAAIPGRWMWTVDTKGWDKGTVTTPAPGGWRLAGERRFAEIYGNDYQIVLRLYEREN
jgi:hypothetical protein